ncbi:MAG: hypothetical protein ACKO7U_08410 [Actinomycetota bacterium]
MARWIAVHLPHIVPPILALLFLARMAVWAAAQPPSHFTDEEVEEWSRARAAERTRRDRPVRRRTALFGLVALGPLALSFLTGLAIYTLSLRGDASPGWLIWSHVATGAFGLAVVSLKSAELGWRRILSRVQATRPQDAIASITMLALGVPIAITGVLMLFRPSGGDFTPTDYLHVIVGVWWVLIVQWHLFRYLGRALKAVGSEPAASGPAG